MKKGLLFLFTFVLWIAMQFIGNSSRAFDMLWFQYLHYAWWPSVTVPTFSDDFSLYCWAWNSSQIYASNFWDKFGSSYNKNCNFYNFSIYHVWATTNNSSSYTACSRNWVWVIKEPNWYRFEWLIDDEKMVNTQFSSFDWFLQTFPDWNQYLMDEFFLWHDSIIFRNSQTKKTFQRIWRYGLFNRIVIANPRSSLNGINNLRLIDFEDMKARSAKVSREVARQFMLWQIPLSPTVLQAQNWVNWYDIIEGWNSFFPTGIDWFGSKCWTQNIVRWNYYPWDWYFLSFTWWYTYSFNDSISEPNFDATWSIDIIPSTQTQNYNDCFWRYNTVSNVANSIFACQNQWVVNVDNFTWIINYIENYNWDDSLLPSEITSNEICQSTIIDSRRLYSMYSWSYQSLINIALRSSNVPNWVDVAWYCWSRPIDNSELSVWESLLNFIWLWDNGWFARLKDSLENYINDTFQDTIRTPMSSTFEEWYSKYWYTQCNSPIVHTSYWNIILYFFGAVIVFIFLVFF